MIYYSLMQKAPLLIIFGSVILLIGFVVGYSFLNNQNTQPQTNSQTSLNQEVASPSAQDIVGTFEYFWGNTCPHCKIVADFLENWALKDKIKIDKKEVYDNKNNASLLVEKAIVCKISQDQIAVPFLFTPTGKCIVGDQPIIEYLKKINL